MKRERKNEKEKERKICLDVRNICMCNKIYVPSVEFFGRFELTRRVNYLFANPLKAGMGEFVCQIIDSGDFVF